MTPAERLEHYPELLVAINTIAEIAEVVGADRKTVAREVAPLISILKLQGALPPCECGRERFHQCNCTARRWVKPHTIRIPRKERTNAIVQLLIDGMTYREVAKIFDMPRASVVSKIKHLTPEQRQLRRENGFFAQRKGAAA